MYRTLGYYVTCDDALCEDCFHADGYEWPGFEGWEAPLAISETDEADTPTHCVECKDLIPHELTKGGYAYVEGAIEGLIVHDDGEGEIVRAWWQAYRDDIQTDDIISECIEARI